MAWSPLVRLSAILVLAIGVLLAARPAVADRMALWWIVHDQCVPAADRHEALPPPCLEVHGGDALIKDRNGVAQLLEIPTARVTGMEDPQLLKPGGPNYFADAWRDREAMSRYVKAPSGSVSIAVNAMYARSQDQLHLHVDCLRADVVKALGEYAPHLDAQWRTMAIALNGRRYWARRVDSTDLSGVDPFRLLADDLPQARDEMGNWSLAAAPAPDGRGFLLLADHVELTAGGHAEDLQDHACTVAN